MLFTTYTHSSRHPENPYGVRHYTVPDFQFICVSACIEGKIIPNVSILPQWSIYLDGYAYHAKEPNIRFYKDLEKTGYQKKPT